MALSTKELLKILEENKDDSLPRSKPVINEVHRFINCFKIKDGVHPVRKVLAYNAFKLWTDKRISPKTFHSQFSQFFMQQKCGHYVVYMLNYRGVELINKVDNFK